MNTVLILTYYWPPAGGPGVQRVLKFAKYLPSFGWRPVILTVANGEYPAIDETLLNDIADQCAVYKTPSLEPFALYRSFTGQKSGDKISTFVLTEDSQAGLTKRFASFIRGNIFIPDARIGWKPYAVQQGMRLMQNEDVNLIFSTAPPMSTHLIAKRLAKKSGLPWVADFRDPWTDVFYYHNLKRTRAAITLDKRLEKSVLSSANAVITVSPTIQKLFETKAPNNYHVIPNGYDGDDFLHIEPAPDDNKIHIVHAGHLAVNQNPVGLWNALKQVLDTNITFEQKLQIDFYGSIHSDVHHSLQDAGLLPYSIFHNYIPHDKLVAVMKRAALLLFVIPDTSYAKGIPTSKLFDYMGAGRPILGIGPEDGDAAQFINQAQVGRVIDDSNQNELVHVLRSVTSDQFQIDNGNMSHFTRSELTKSLAHILNKAL
jgi:glycosyltransferase involved in cell wall biosynthesis